MTTITTTTRVRIIAVRLLWIMIHSMVMVGSTHPSSLLSAAPWSGVAFVGVGRSRSRTNDRHPPHPSSSQSPHEHESLFWQASPFLFPVRNHRPCVSQQIMRRLYHDSSATITRTTSLQYQRTRRTTHGPEEDPAHKDGTTHHHRNNRMRYDYGTDYIQDDRSRHAHDIQSIKGASSFKQIDRLLCQMTRRTSRPEDGTQETLGSYHTHHEEEEEEGSSWSRKNSPISVNVAVAALKRITVLWHGSDPTQPNHTHGRKQSRRGPSIRRRRPNEERDRMEMMQYWVPRLMHHVTQTMEEWSHSNNSNHNHTSSSLQQQIPFTNYALADLFFVVSQFDWFLLQPPNANNNNNSSSMPFVSRPPSIQSLCQLALGPDGGKTFVTQVSPAKLMNVWVALSPWKGNDSTTRKHTHMMDQKESDGENQHMWWLLLRQVIGTRLSQGDAMGQLSPRLLSQGLWAMAHHEDVMVHGTLLKALCRRWRKERVRAMATPSDIVRATWSTSRIMEHLEQQQQQQLDHNNLLTTTPPLFMSSSGPNETMEDPDWTMQVAMLREEAEIMVHTLFSRCLLTRPTTTPPNNANHDASHNNTTTSHNNDSIQNDTMASLAVPLTMGQIADILSACVTFEIGSEQPIVMALSAHLATTTTTTTTPPFSNSTHQTNTSFQDLARILLSLQRLRACHIPDTIHNLGQHALQKVQYQQQQQHRRNPYQRQVDRCDPKTWNMILRSAVMIHPKQQYILEPYLIATKQLILGGENDNDNDDWNAFLSKACEFQVSNYIWVMSMAKWYDEELLIALSNRMMDDDILRSCSPSSASRAMWAFTTLLAETDPSWEKNDNDEELQLSLLSSSMLSSSSSSSSEVEEEDRRSMIMSNQNGKMAMREQLFELFHNLGGILLSSQLTPVDVSSALFAYGKANYALDMGIVDHLAEVLACDFMLERATTRQVSQALWACGRMIDWDDSHYSMHHNHNKNNQYSNGAPQQGQSLSSSSSSSSSHNQQQMQQQQPDLLAPPYLRCARQFAQHLALHKDKMTTKDVAQTIWALGRLRIMDYAEIVEPLALAASDVAPNCNAQEIANILWGLSKVDYHPFHPLILDTPNYLQEQTVISNLTRRMMMPEVLHDCSSQEAATVLYALGRMKVRNESVFAAMSSVMMQRLTDTHPHPHPDKHHPLEEEGGGDGKQRHRGASRVVSAQSIANALWAHQEVGIKPPQSLFDSWAFGMVNVVGLSSPPFEEKEMEEKAAADKLEQEAVEMAAMVVTETQEAASEPEPVVVAPPVIHENETLAEQAFRVLVELGIVDRSHDPDGSTYNMEEADNVAKENKFK